MDILLASYNNHKIMEIQEIINNELPNKINIINPQSVLPAMLEIDENGKTFEENAFIKAKAFYDAMINIGNELTCIADDSGLQVDALNGNPGIYSARFAGIHGDDTANRFKVLDLLKDIPYEQRTARFVACICMIKDNIAYYYRGVCEGKITFQENGANGFGYDPIFIPDGYSITFAEMPAELKNDLSHRGKAIRKFVDYLKKNC